MMSSPFPTLIICLIYVYIVKVLGPKMMENRKPFQLKNALIVYNMFQMVFSAWLFYEVTSTFYSRSNLLLRSVLSLLYFLYVYLPSYRIACIPYYRYENVFVACTNLAHTAKRDVRVTEYLPKSCSWMFGNGYYCRYSRTSGETHQAQKLKTQR